MDSCHIVIACICLNNLCVRLEEQYDHIFDDRDEDDDDEDNESSDNNSDTALELGKLKRNALKVYLST